MPKHMGTMTIPVERLGRSTVVVRLKGTRLWWFRIRLLRAWAWVAQLIAPANMEVVVDDQQGMGELDRNLSDVLDDELGKDETDWIPRP